jgi:hypothetical protein
MKKRWIYLDDIILDDNVREQFIDTFGVVNYKNVSELVKTADERVRKNEVDMPTRLDMMELDSVKQVLVYLVTFAAYSGSAVLLVRASKMMLEVI